MNLCQEQKDKPGEQSVKRDVLCAALRVSRDARDEESRALNVALGGGPPGRSAVLHARLPAVFGAQVAW